MSKDTNIEWCDSSSNPTTGCDGCELWNNKVKTCYAGILHSRYGGKNKGFAPTFEQVTMFPGRMAQAAKWSDLRGVERPGKPWIPKELPRLVFISDMSDALSGGITFEYLEQEIIDVVEKWKHIGIWLTKRPRRMAEFSRWLEAKGRKWPANLWAMTSVTDEKSAHARIPSILEVGDEQTIHGISAEPLIESFNLQDINTPSGTLEALRGKLWPKAKGELPTPARKLDWVIVGGESGTNGVRPCSLSQMSRLVAECDKFGTACFVKQLGSNPTTFSGPSAPGIHPGWAYAKDVDVKLKNKKGGDPSEWPAHLNIRQFPNPKEVTHS